MPNHTDGRWKRFAAAAMALAAATTMTAVLGLPELASGAVRPANCPRRAPQAIAVNPWPSATNRLAPRGVETAHVCQYSGVDGAVPFKLLRSTRIASKAERQQLVRELDNLPRLSPIAVCPNDDGAQIVLLLNYQDGHRVTVSVGSSGCEIATNGDVTRTASRSQLVAELERIAARALRTVPARSAQT